ncbi:anti-sigma factor domain-containing protein [Streptomyces sp. NPDC002328]|uniref:anti-sigma factor n=1 Tax=Streptomyces sp. NPDC002328 TaxID=3364642 RepID=UPI0036AC63EF
MNRIDDDPHLDVGAYVLHALPPDEEAAFENHLAGCDACRQEVEQLSRAAVELGAAESSPPPAELRRRVLDQIAAVRQDRSPVPASRIRRQRILRLALAASVAAAAALGGVAWWQNSQADTAREQSARARAGYRQLAGVLTAPDATITTGDLTHGGTASVVASRARGRAAFVATGLPPLTGDRVYQLWYAGSGGFRPAGLLPSAGGRQTRVLDGPLAGATAVGITVEPAGGSPQPTTAPLGVISIAA